MLEILTRRRGPTGIAQAGRRKLTAIAATPVPRLGDTLIAAIMTALEEQTAVVPGTNAALICLARRCDVLFTMLRDKTHHRHPRTAPAPTPA
ncbi:hypothetical protein SAMN05216174_1224 [Actinokineospora iranica]|uniref:Uncharacterized protein n=1 Tax=Actinokineospora iranica TaxID=1271860 RepID=A0A1G6YIS3_9PSEU|nr:hypothetical protein SAMN05216174_1224 [Actinokineospora iranica]